MQATTVATVTIAVERITVVAATTVAATTVAAATVAARRKVGSVLATKNGRSAENCASRPAESRRHAVRVS